jgi:orotate phosphoribosyltransferase
LFASIIMTNSKVIAEKLLQIDAVKLNVKEPYTWASGWKSPIYCDNRRVLSFPYVRDYFKSELCNLIFEKFSHAELIAGVATAGIAWGAMAADQLKLPFVYVRPKPKDHGLGNQVEGFFVKGQKVVVVEDLVSTGASSLLVAEVLIFSYNFNVAASAFGGAGIPYYSLTDYPSLIEVAKERGTVTDQEQDILLKWRDDPPNWKGVL